MKSINLLGLWFYGYLYVLQSASFFYGLQVGCLQSASFFLVSKKVTCRVQSASFFLVSRQATCRVPRFSGIQVGYLQTVECPFSSLQVLQVTCGGPGFIWSPGWLPVECLVFPGLQVGYLQSASFFLVSKQVTCRGPRFFWSPGRYGRETCTRRAGARPSYQP